MFSWLTDWFSSGSGSTTSSSGCDINPASGLPMIGGCGGVDVEGNPYGTDLSNDDSFSSNDNFSSSFSSDDSFSSSWSDDSSSSGCGNDW